MDGKTETLQIQKTNSKRKTQKLSHVKFGQLGKFGGVK
jgi:hypothetical protein